MFETEGVRCSEQRDHPMQRPGGGGRGRMRSPRKHGGSEERPGRTVGLDPVGCLPKVLGSHRKNFEG